MIACWSCSTIWTQPNKKRVGLTIEVGPTIFEMKI